MITIAVMGLGKLGEFSASKLSDFGFNVIAWSRTQKSIDGVRSYAGNELSFTVKYTDLLIASD